jgi:hypothetical protein
MINISIYISVDQGHREECHNLLTYRQVSPEYVSMPAGIILTSEIMNWIRQYLPIGIQKQSNPLTFDALVNF